MEGEEWVEEVIEDEVCNKEWLFLETNETEVEVREEVMAEFPE